MEWFGFALAAVIAVIYLLIKLAGLLISVLKELAELFIRTLKRCLFDPLPNSVISIIIYALMIYKGALGGIELLLIPSIIDCILDIKCAREYTAYSDFGKDHFYARKSIAALLTLGLSRSINLLVERPWHYISARTLVLRRKVVTSEDFHKTNTRYNLIARKYIGIGIASGTILEREDTGSCNGSGEITYYIARNFMEVCKNNAYNTIIDRSAIKLDALMDCKEMLSSRKCIANKAKTVDIVRFYFLVMEELVKDRSIVKFNTNNSPIYISTEFVERSKHSLISAMNSRSWMSPNDIAKLSEVQSLFTTENIKKYLYGSIAVMYITYIITVLYSEGTLQRDSFNDKDPNDKFQYKLKVGGKPMALISASKVPDLALDN